MLNNTVPCLFSENHLADRHLAIRHLAIRHLAYKYLANSSLDDRHLTKGIWLAHSLQLAFGWQAFG
jgi:hypothetical protein